MLYRLSSTRAHRFAVLPVLIVLGTVALTGCAEREAGDDRSAAAEDAFPVTIEEPGAGAAVTLDTRPDRIVSLSPSVTEVLYAVGAGDQVVAVDEMSDHPEHAPTTEMSGLTPSPETIASHEPDLVVVGADTEGLSDSLAQAGIDTLVVSDAKSLDGAYERYALLGRATGHEQAGNDLADQVREEIEQRTADAADPTEPLSYYHELDPNFTSATSATFIGDVYDQFDLHNIADGDDPTELGGYPQLSAEHILDADPELIFLADTECCAQDAAEVAERPGWDTLSAVTANRVIELDDDTASRWGPRIVEMVDAVAAAVTDAVS